MTEDNLEQAIQDKNLTAPRLTPLGISKVIKKETFTMLPSMKVLVCELTLENGYTVRGEAAVVSPENFDLEIGQRISRENARKKVWELEGYLLQQKLYEKTKKEPLGTGSQQPVNVPAFSIPQPWNQLQVGALWRYQFSPTLVYQLDRIDGATIIFKSEEGITLPMNLDLISKSMTFIGYPPEKRFEN